MSVSFCEKFTKIEIKEKLKYGESGGFLKLQ